MPAQTALVGIALVAGLWFHAACWGALRTPVIVGRGLDGVQTFAVGFHEATITIDRPGRDPVSVETVSWADVPGLREASRLLCWAATLTATNLVLSATLAGILLAVLCRLTQLSARQPARWVFDTILAVLLIFTALTHLLIAGAQQHIAERLPQFIVEHLGPKTVEVSTANLRCGSALFHPTVAAVAFGLASVLVLRRSSRPQLGSASELEELRCTATGESDDAAEMDDDSSDVEIVLTVSVTVSQRPSKKVAADVTSRAPAGHPVIM